MPKPATLMLPQHARHRWSLRLVEAASSAAALGKPWKTSSPPLPWYAKELARLCAGTSDLSSQLMALEAQKKKSWMWKDGGLLAQMLADCGDMLLEAVFVIEATSAALRLPLRTTLHKTRERCLPATLSQPVVPPCLPCSAEEAVTMTQASLARLRGAGAALALVLRFEEDAADEAIRPDFFEVVPFVEMALSSLGGLTKLVARQLEHDLPYVPANLGNDGPLADPSSMTLVGSPSINSAWAEQEADILEDEAPLDQKLDDVGQSPSEPAVEVPEESPNTTKSRKSVKKKTVSGPKVGKKKSGA